jgi:NAD(P)-dependent dehydrogenase (short-subunit alcohol dehydrogenase family)
MRPSSRGARAELPSLRTVTLDVTSEDDARDAIAMIHEQLGGLDILVNSAGVMYGYALTDSDAETRSEEETQINLLGSLPMTRLALPLLLNPSPLRSFAGLLGTATRVAEGAARVEPVDQAGEVGQALIEGGDGRVIREEHLGPSAGARRTGPARPPPR